MSMQRAYSTIEIKAMDDSGSKRRFSGIATTPEPDRAGDIVDPKGVEFKLPIPLLWQHDSRSPIGWITSAKVTPKGIDVEGEVASIDDAGKLRDRLDEAWQSIKSKLVRGLSIGFKPLESARIGDTYSYRYMKWLWLELSAVTIPMNGDCSIMAVKSADQAIRRAASGARPVVRLDTAPAAAGTTDPGASGQQKTRRKGAVYLN